MKLLPFTVDVDVVFGSRTVQTFILQRRQHGLRSCGGGTGPSPSWPMVLFNTVHLSDVGCTFRVLSARRDRPDSQPEFERNDSSFGFEMMLHRAEPAACRSSRCR